MNSSKLNPSPVSALLTLLQDDDLKVASLAMEQFLNLGLAEAAVAEYQESGDPHLRQRIHQLGGILARRRAREEFMAAVRSEQFSTWEGIVEINALYDPQCPRDSVSGFMEELAAKAGPGASPAHIAALMREAEFCVPDEDLLDIELYLVERVMDTRYGSPAVLCAIAQESGRQAGWNSTIALHEGRFCLIDRHSVLLDPSEGWNVQKLDTAEKVHPCSPKDLWLGVLTQMFLISLVEGNLRDLYHFGDLLAALNGAAIETILPYPLGQSEA